MKKIIIVLFSIYSTLSLWNCTGNKVISPAKPESQASVCISMKNGAKHEGIIFKGNGKQLFYIDAETHNLDTLKVASIAGIQKIDKYFDFQAQAMPLSEIKAHQSWKRTLLYGGGGLVLGAAAGWGLSIILFRNTGNATAARTIIAGLGVSGAWLFGSKGYGADFDDAVFTTRKIRAEKVAAVQKQKLKELKKEKAQLEKLKREKEKLPH